jgi:triosephosphate isomerase
MRPLLFAANWKMNLGTAEAERFATEFLARAPEVSGRDIWFFPPLVSLSTLARALRGRADIRVGAQDTYWEPGGAFTGATSVSLAQAAGATVGLVGHSERRHIFGETDDESGLKVAALLAGGLTPVLCVGEKLDEREANRTEEVITRQLTAGLAGVKQENIPRVVIAYEPVWAIGTGKNATPADAAAVHSQIREHLVRLGTPERSQILYGGSVKAENVGALLAEPELDGVLVGGASLDPAGWAKLVAIAVV